MEHTASYVNQLVLNEDELEEHGIVKGGYPMSNIVSVENLSYQMLGGGKSIGGNRFEDLVIPLSLDTHTSLDTHMAKDTYYGGGNNESIIETKSKKNKIPEILDEDRFNRIFDSIILIKKRREKDTKKNMTKPTSKTTRKSKSK
jgi:hypothetical protein